MTTPRPATPDAGNRPRRRRVILALAIGLLLAGATAEVGLRVVCMENGLFLGRRALPPFGTITNPAQRAWVDRWRERLANGDAHEGLGEYSQVLGWTMRPSVVDGKYAINAMRARGPREYEPDPPEGVFRLLCFGDSFTFCSDVGNEDAWPAQMETLSKNVEAINFGVGAYGTDQALLRYRKVRDSVRSHAVFIGIMLDDVNRNVNRYRPLYYPNTKVTYAKPRFVLGADNELTLLPLPFRTFAEFLGEVHDGSVIETLREHEHWTPASPPLSSLVSARLLAGLYAYTVRDHRRSIENPESEAFRVTVAILERFHREAIIHGAAVAPVVLFPAPDDLEAAEDEGRFYWQPLVEELRTRGVPCLDVTPNLLAASRSRGLAIRSIYAGGHLTPDSNREVADVLVAYLEQTIPATANPRPQRR